MRTARAPAAGRAGRVPTPLDGEGELLEGKRAPGLAGARVQKQSRQRCAVWQQRGWKKANPSMASWRVPRVSAGAEPERGFALQQPAGVGGSRLHPCYRSVAGGIPLRLPSPDTRPFSSSLH